MKPFTTCKTLKSQKKLKKHKEHHKVSKKKKKKKSYLKELVKKEASQKAHQIVNQKNGLDKRVG